MPLERTNLLGMDREAMQRYFVSLGAREFHARQFLQWVYQRGITEFVQMTNLSKALRARLLSEATLEMPRVASEQLSSDGTRKWLLQLADGNHIETVFIPEDDRGTLCVSSQVGCALNCSFCATARQGYSRNLEASEIISQVWLAQYLLHDSGYTERAITNIVLMGMGEPLLNYEAVVPVINLMLDDLSYGLSRRRITLSTAGVVPAIDRLAKECPINLAVSLHAARDALRDQLVPLNRKYPIKQLLSACRRYAVKDSRRQVTFEYVMLAGVNDSIAEAKELGQLLSGLPAKVNLIPFNPVPGIGYRSSSTEVIDRFRDQLLTQGLMTITRRTRGGDIAAACGQLAGVVKQRRRHKTQLAVNA